MFDVWRQIWLSMFMTFHDFMFLTFLSYTVRRLLYVLGFYFVGEFAFSKFSWCFFSFLTFLYYFFDIFDHIFLTFLLLNDKCHLIIKLKFKTSKKLKTIKLKMSKKKRNINSFKLFRRVWFYWCFWLSLIFGNIEENLTSYVYNFWILVILKFPIC